MKSKTPLALMELLIMVLVFAIAAALCLRCFVLADRASARNALRDEAVSAVQTAAETVKACHGNYGEAAYLLDGTWENGQITVASHDGFVLIICPEKSDVSLLGTARIEAVSTGEEELLFALTTAWQEVAQHE